jgi:lycopene cyclase domain-containing protein
MIFLGQNITANNLQNWEYLLVLLLCVSLPLGFFLFHPRIKLRENWKILLISLTVSVIPFLIWDYFATLYGHWQFNPDFILGIYLANLPMEEVLFFLAIPFCCHFVWWIITNYDSPRQLWQDFWLK